MANDTQESLPTDQIDHAVGESISSLHCGSECEGQETLAEDCLGSSGDCSPSGSVFGESDSGETDQTGSGDEAGHGEDAEADLSESGASNDEANSSFFAEAAAEVSAAVINAAANTAHFDDLYWDGRNFYMRNPNGNWSVESVAMVTAELKVRGFSDKAPKGASCSPMDRAKVTIRKDRKVDGAAPRLYCKNETYTDSGEVLLNTARVKLFPAEETAGDWGEFFPRYAAILDNVFDSDLYKTTFLAWFKRFYESAEAGELALGQSMALVGPVQCFKSFIIEKLLTPAMGGSADLSDMASGETSFNSEIYHAPIAVIDDSKGTSSEAMRSRYSAVIKKLAATGKHKFHEKYGQAKMVEWKGRVVLGLNNDPRSIKLLPDFDQSNEDKMIALHLHQWLDHPEPSVYSKIVDEELSHFLAWLKAWVIPAEVADPMSRYGIKSVISEKVREAAFQSSPESGLLELIQAWWAKLPSSESRKPWVGTALELREVLTTSLETSSRDALRGLEGNKLGYKLKDLCARPDTGLSLIPKTSKKKDCNKYKIFITDVESSAKPSSVHVNVG